MNDTIVAVSSAQGGCAFSIVRLSGRDAKSIASSVVEGELPKKGFCWRNVMLLLGEMKFPARVVVFNSPLSYTTEDVIEFHIYGGGITSALLVDALIKAGARVAEAGEFTRRAFERGRIGLLQAEAVNMLIRARDEAERRESIESLTGETERRYRRIRAELTELLGLVEAELDFSDQDINVVEQKEFLTALRRLMRSMRKMRPKATVEASVPRVVIEGKTNVGKSTLFNALLGRERSVADDKPHMTKDFVEEYLTIDDIRFILVDTAGDGKAEVAEAAAVVLSVKSADSLDREETSGWRRDERTIRVINKADKGLPLWFKDIPDVVVVSALYGYGLEELRRTIFKRLSFGAEGDSFYLLRCRSAVTEALTELCHAYSLIRSEQSKELVAFHLQNALYAFYTIYNGDLTEDMLDTVFSRFCIGK